MIARILCDHCKKPIDEVVYVLVAKDPEHIDSSRDLRRNHLHWNCLPLFGRK